MQTKPKSNSVVTHRLEAEGRAIVFVVKDAGEVTLDLGKLSNAVFTRAATHGLIQRVSDRAAIGRDPKTFKPVDPMVKLEAMRGLVEHYHTGTEDWAMVRVGGGAGPGQETLWLVAALREIYPQRTEEQLRSWLGKRTKAEKAALMTSDKVGPVVERLRSEAGEGVKAEELLSELDFDEGEGEGDETESDSEPKA